MCQKHGTPLSPPPHSFPSPPPVTPPQADHLILYPWGVYFSQEVIMKTVEIIIDGMHCGGCVQRATDAIKKVAGAVPEKVEIGKARVQLDENKATPDAVVAALENLGFDAHLSAAE